MLVNLIDRANKILIDLGNKDTHIDVFCCSCCHDEINDNPYLVKFYDNSCYVGANYLCFDCAEKTFRFVKNADRKYL